tara:strand:+ start:18 stop:1652 length:1635 start_codon:yes stop_codon:yes gene_type:complete
MANGRLGKVVVAPNGTSAVYTNSSGAEASCTILGTSENGSIMTLKIDDSSAAVTLSTTLVSEAYNQRYLRYLAGNTTLTTGAPTYIGRLAHTATTVANSLFKLFYEFFDSSANATYGATVANAGDHAFRMAPNIINSYDVWKTLGTTRLVVPNNRGSNEEWRVNMFEETLFSDADTYYKLALNRDDQNSATPTTRSALNAYGACGVTVDPYETEMAMGFSIHDNGYMRAAVYRYEGTDNLTWYYGSETSGSIVYNRVTGSNSVTPSASVPVPTLIAQNRLYTFDRTSNGPQMIMWTTSDASGYNASSASSIPLKLIDVNETMSVTLNMQGARPGGTIVFFQYNPADKLHYIGLAQGNSTTTIHLVTMDRSVLQAKADASHVEISFTNIETSTSASTFGFKYVGTVPSFTASGSLAFSDANTTSSCMRIGTSLWAATISRMGSTIAAETIYSTDLKTWKTAAAFYSPNDYTETIDATTITSSSGAAVASKSNIGNLGATGVLENNLAFTQYERTGLVLSNGDRVLVFNGDSTNSMVMQVMGFEGT